MIPKIHVLREFNKIESLYQKASADGDVTLTKLYSKLATIELCSWIEECMDDLAIKVSKRKRLTAPENIKFLEEEIIRKNYGFGYDRYFRMMLMKVVGIIELEYLENKVNQVKKQGLKSALSKFEPERNAHAHKTIRTTLTFSAPSTCVAEFKNIYIGLEEYEKWLRKI